MYNSKPTIDRRTFVAGAVSLASLSSPGCSQQESPLTTATDFSRSFCHYTATGEKRIWVRIQIECRCQIFDRSWGDSDEYLLTVKTQTGLRTQPPSDALDPGYDFWMIFSKKHVFIKRVHTSSYNHNPTRNKVEDFEATGWHLEPSPARELRSGAEIREALEAWLPLVARSEFVDADGLRGYVIEYPVKWADGNPDNTFRIETGPVVLLDTEKVKVGQSPDFDDFQWAYLDYRSLDQVRCFLERSTSILSGATYQPPAHVPRRHPALTAEQVARIEGRLFEGWKPPIPVDQLRRLFQTDHHSAIAHLPVATKLYALEQ